MLIREHPNRVVSGSVTYIARIFGDERVDGTWEGWIEFHSTDSGEGWIEFHSTDSGHPILTTEQETSQPNRKALEYWADGLEPIYLEGALARAQGRLL